MKIKGVTTIVEPDRFAVGAILTNAFPGLTLSVAAQPDEVVVVTSGFSTVLDRNFASTGVRVFGTDPAPPLVPQGWNDQFGLLRVDFDRGTDFVQIDLGADDADVGELRAFDANGTLLDTVRIGGSGFSAQYGSPSISFADGRIAFITVGGIGSDAMWLDNFSFGILGTDERDTITGTANGDHYNGRGGSDTIKGLAGDDILVGGAGEDILYGGRGSDTLDVDSGDNDRIDTVVFQSKTEGTDFISRFDVTGNDHDLVEFSGSFNKGTRAPSLDDETNDNVFQFREGSNGVDNDSGVLIDLNFSTLTTADDGTEAVIFSSFPEGVGRSVRYDDPDALARYSREFSNELAIFADPRDDLLIVSNGDFASGPDQFAAFLYIENGSGSGANGTDREISEGELTLLGIFESNGNVTADHFIFA